MLCINQRTIDVNSTFRYTFELCCGPLHLLCANDVLLTVYKNTINYCHATNPLSIRYQRAIYKRSPHPAHAINVRCDHAINVLSIEMGSTCYCYVYCLCAIHVISLNYQLTIDMLSICHRVLCTLCSAICCKYAIIMLLECYPHSMPV